MLSDFHTVNGFSIAHTMATYCIVDLYTCLGLCAINDDVQLRVNNDLRWIQSHSRV